MGYYCNECDADISEKFYNFSKKKFNRPLCMECQKQVKPKTPYKKTLTRKLPTPKSTPEARKLGNILRDEYGWKVELEKFDGYKHIDIAIVSVKVNIEVDGSQHNLQSKQALADLQRTFHSFKKGYLTVRIPNCLVRDEKHLKKTARYLNKFLRASEEQLEEEYEYY